MSGALCAAEDSAQGAAREKAQDQTLKNRFAPLFDVGTAVSPFQLEGLNAEFVARHFNSLTPENCMKPEALYRPDGNYHFAPADAIVRFAKANGMKVRGHTLVWHSQTPRKFFVDHEGTPLDKDALYARMEEYISKVMNHFRGDVYCWDVVNEALSDEGDEIYRTRSPWFEVCGKDFIAHAFRVAHKVDPNVKLFYNDYNLISPAKREKAVRMLRELLASGVPVAGVGMQAHWDMETFDPLELQKSIDAFVELGLEVQITELDLTIYPPYHGAQDAARSGSAPRKDYTPEIEERHAEKYAQVFEVLCRNADHITSVTFWGITDRYSWLNMYPCPGRTDHPLLFDRENRPKEAFHRVMEAKESSIQTEE